MPPVPTWAIRNDLICLAVDLPIEMGIEWVCQADVSFHPGLDRSKTATFGEITGGFIVDLWGEGCVISGGGQREIPLPDEQWKSSPICIVYASNNQGIGRGKQGKVRSRDSKGCETNSRKIHDSERGNSRSFREE
jgi:hypothetical protein